ncbi:MAG: DUF1727 domain-containing protein [Chloroflexi bacterium]|nr:DUF1727 domain-containing protein [Chloroflexota bacterium]
MRTTLAVLAARLTRALLVAGGRGATALPGVVGLAIDPALVTRLSRSLRRGVACVTGTNGKTTTTRMLSDIVRAAGWTPVHNRSGSNLERGLAAALVSARGDVGLFELDEASVPRVLARVAPRVLVVTNLFRDQLDRYFEIDALQKRIGSAIAALPSGTTLVLNADDPLVAHLGDSHSGKMFFFGVDDPRVGGTTAQAISDATRCPRCRSPLRYTRVVLAHIGDWRCPSCGFARPARDIAASEVALGPDGSTLRVSAITEPVLVPLPGLYNAYNALAALAGARALDIPLADAAAALASFKPAFGRLERVPAEGRTLRLVLVKNPAGFNAAIGALTETGRHPRLLAALSDLDADGRDVSWIWDADFETLAQATTHAVVTGLRARDLALRFKYAGLELTRLEVVESWRGALERAIALTPVGEELAVIATYTAMLALRRALAQAGHVAPFWED